MIRQFVSPAHLLVLALLISLVIAGIAAGLLGFDASDLARRFQAEPLSIFLQAWPKKYEGIG
jgi:hypothetical protein